MDPIKKFIRGLPYPKPKSGNDAGLREWTQVIVEETRGLPKVKGECSVDVEFVLPAGQFNPNTPYGTDLDNLLKALLDALSLTVFSELRGKDAAAMELCARKSRSLKREDCGARVEIDSRLPPAQ